MEQYDGTRSSLTLYGGGDRGAGGKFRKPSSRKAPSTPYDRPSAAAKKQTGWLSKIVDPAYRLISGGTTRIFPSFFSKSAPSGIENPSDDRLDQESDQDGSGDDQEDTYNLGFRSSEGAGPSTAEDIPRCESDFNNSRRSQKASLAEDNGLSQIELMLQGKSLSRDEINRLTEILHSKAIDLSKDDQLEKKISMSAEREAAGSLTPYHTPKTSTKEKPESSNKARWEISTPLPSSSQIRDAVAASPIDIARAYMGSRTLDISSSSRSLMSKDERPSADDFALKPSIPLPSAKPTCWPGSTVQDQRGYMTPQNGRGKMGLHSFPRTPYSRTIFSKSKSKSKVLQGDSSRSINSSSTSFQQFRSPGIEEMKSRGSGLNDGYGSVGPIRRTHRKYERTPSRGFVPLHSFINSPASVDKLHAFDAYPPAFKNSNHGTTSGTSKFELEKVNPKSYEVGSTSVPPQSCRIARQILEHIDRKLPTPAEKSAELKLAISSTKASSKEFTTPMVPKEDSSKLPIFNNIDTRKNIFSAQGNEYAKKDLFKPQVEERNAREADEEGRGNISSSIFKLGNPIGNSVPSFDFGKNSDSRTKSGNARSSFDFGKNSDSQIKTTQEKTSIGGFNSGQKDNNTLQPHHNYENGQGNTNIPNIPKFRSHSSPNKPNLPSISINKPGLNPFSQNSNTGFTFPVPGFPSTISEPPTPSIMPTGTTHQKKEEPVVPTYSFGTKRSAPSIVFSFPSSNASSSPIVEDSEIKFKFGSENKTRLSFSSFEKNGVCY